MKLQGLTKNQVRKAGEVLAKSFNVSDDTEELRQALQVVSAWREIHQEPLNRVFEELRGIVSAIPQALVTSRLKRTDTIVGKLRRPYANFKLNQMCDIIGCRIIVQDMNDLHIASQKVCSSELFTASSARKDYIAYPKETGYRSLHLILKVDAPESGFSNLSCEVQVRTVLQHAWATALETYDVIGGNALKFDGGSNEEKKFFQYAASAFAQQEGTPTVPGISDSVPGLARKLAQLESQLRIVQRLRAASGAVTVVARNREFEQSAYCLMEIDYETQSSLLRLYDETEEARANEEYARLEQDIRSAREKHPLRDALLTKISSIKSLEAGYPNYLSDITVFLTEMDKLLSRGSGHQ